ncbi:uncharacterized protein LOC128218967 [Mya arenaria]|uniref:uncharacterized protein LOC128218967 n=1 Tax=Mya arenaria TaxID=6604 RepID=UPI0022E806CF|nr:uncharacterized protein LOC128218967 [Mya arenaria]XP_052782714.1 uncharacterized protein LOC128218967 [Mya arenaria]
MIRKHRTFTYIICFVLGMTFMNFLTHIYVSVYDKDEIRKQVARYFHHGFRVVSNVSRVMSFSSIDTQNPTNSYDRPTKSLREQMAKLLSNVTAKPIVYNAERNTRNIRRLAFGYYAVTREHFIATIVNIKRLRKLATRNVDFIILTNLVSKIKTSPDVKIIKYPKLQSPFGYYKDCFTKLLFFNMTDYERIIFMDVDTLVLKSPDVLFDLPPVPLAAPIAYWLDPPEFTSALLVIQPERRLWEAISAKIGDVIIINLFDMNLLNNFYKHTLTTSKGFTFPEILVLPGYFLTLSPHFKENITWTDEMRPKSVISPFLDIEKLWNYTYVVHFSGGPKPWDLSEQTIKNTPSVSKYYSDVNLVFKHEYNEISKKMTDT